MPIKTLPLYFSLRALVAAAEHLDIQALSATDAKGHVIGFLPQTSKLMPSCDPNDFVAWRDHAILAVQNAGRVQRTLDVLSAWSGQECHLLNDVETAPTAPVEPIAETMPAGETSPEPERAPIGAKSKPEPEPKRPSFNVRRLHVMTYAAGFTLWVYEDRETLLDDVIAPGYFDAASDMFNPGDQMHVSAPDGAALIVVSVSGLASVAVQIMSLVRFNPAVEPLAPLVAA